MKSRDSPECFNLSDDPDGIQADEKPDVSGRIAAVNTLDKIIRRNHYAVGRKPTATESVGR